MSLTLSLALIGLVLLALTAVHGIWMQRRKAPRRAKPSQPVPPSDPTPPGAGVAARIDNAFAQDTDSRDHETAVLLPVSSAASTLTIDPLIDSVALIPLAQPIPGAAALSAMPATRRIGSKALLVEGQTANGEWEILRANSRYTALQAGVQLANRTGALNEIEFSEFVQKITAYADAFGSEAQLPDMRTEVSRAHELDRFADEHDAQLTFTLRARSVAWSTGYVQQHAMRVGFVPGSIPGRMVLPGTDPGSAAMLALNFDSQAAMAEDPEQSAVRQLNLTLDVPQVTRSAKPYAVLREIAITLAAKMDGHICDAQGRVITADGMNAIEADLQAVYHSLESRDLAAGSPQARRLFS